MTRHEWTYDIESTGYTDEIFSRIGRLLYHTTRFEAYCKALSALFNLKTNDEIMDNELTFNKFIEAIEKRNLYKNIEEIKKELKILLDNESVLTEARKARNVVAHSLTNGLEHIFVNAERAEHFERELYLLAEKVITGEFLVISFISALTKEQAPNRDYISNNIKWTIDSE